ncbi:MAG: NAD(P)H-dependent oxidoreductase [Candidatus Omnitrophota bacterium]|nr:NAD(P)H-dependent oxidoreductase [Candidatus Omnitrophota bacterium]
MMKKLLHIIATPRAEASATLKISGEFLTCCADERRDWKIETLNLFDKKLPALTVQHIEGKFHLLGGEDLPDELKEAWRELIVYIEQFSFTDEYLISCPMWNFSIPYVLKHYLDIIVQPKYLFRYTPNGPEGLMKNKKMVIITSRGGDYSGEPARSYDHQIPYLKAIFNFVGITDIRFINAQPMDAMGPDIRRAKIETASSEAKTIALRF